MKFDRNLVESAEHGGISRPEHIDLRALDVELEQRDLVCRDELKRIVERYRPDPDGICVVVARNLPQRIAFGVGCQI